MVSADVECKLAAVTRALGLVPIGRDAFGTVADYGGAEGAGQLLQVRAYAWPAALCRARLQAGKLVLDADGARLWLYISRDGALCAVTDRPDEFRAYVVGTGIVGLDVRGIGDATGKDRAGS